MTINRATIACLLLAAHPAFAEGASAAITIKEVDIEKSGITLPPGILVRIAMKRLEKPERDARNRIVFPNWKDFNDIADIPHYGLSLRSTSDGMTFLCDHGSMTLWIREGELWKAVAFNVHVVKTFGGAPPRLPVSYLGKGLFAVTETLPGEIEERDKENLNLPQALAATFLIDSKSASVLARSEAFLYSENPPIRIPDDWEKRFGIVEATWEK